MPAEPKPSCDAEAAVSPFLCYGLIDPRNGELRYVGKSARGMARPINHRSARGRSVRTHNGYWLRQMWADGETLPSILVLRECENEEQALAHEILLIAIFRAAGFDLTNLTDGGDGTCGRKASPEARARMSASKRGKKFSPLSAEHKAKISAARLGKKFSPLSAEHKAKISAGNLGRKLPPRSAEHKAKISAATLGKRLPPFSAEHKAKISAAQLGKKLSAEHKAKIRAAKLGKKLSAEHKAKLRAVQTARWQRIREAQATPDTVKQETTT